MENPEADCPVQQDFELNEELYRYLVDGDVVVDPEDTDYIRVNPNTLRGPRQPIDLPASSVDRQKFRDPETLAARTQNCGYATITPAALPKPFVAPDGGIWETFPWHCPENGNCAHSEIRLAKDGTFDLSKKPGSQQKKQWRSDLSAAFVVVKQPPQGSQ